LRGGASLGIILSLVENDSLPRQARQILRDRAANNATQNEVDDSSETLHNLSSLLLTNKTIRRIQQGSTE
jgi:hypothetical protein